VISPQDHETERRALELRQDEVDRRFAEAVQEWTRQAHPSEVLALCERFHAWAVEQGVGPTEQVLAGRGWILGRREETVYVTRGADIVEMEISFFLIVMDNGTVLERPGDTGQTNTQPDLLKYRLGSVRAHITAFAALAPGTWIA
jgi:hypothetical protein